MAEKKTPTVFISYARADEAWARRFAQAIKKKAGIDTFVDQYTAGKSIVQQTEAALRKSDHFVVVLSPKSVESQWVNFEIGAAIAGKKHIFPVIKSPTALPEFLNSYNVVEESSATAAADHVVSAIAAEFPIESAGRTSARKLRKAI